VIGVATTHWNGLTQNALTMTIKRAIEVLTEYNKWRRHNGEPCPFKYSSLELGATIDVAIHCMWKLDKMSEIFYFGTGVGDERNQSEVGVSHR